MTGHAATFHALHTAPDMLILPNAWDAGSARLIAHCGAAAIATTSAGVAWSLGYSDGNALPMARYLVVLARIVEVVDVPVTADIEGGYADDPALVAANARRIIDTGAVGINIEDGGKSSAVLADKIAAIRAVTGPQLFINARADTFLHGLADAGAVDDVLARAALYRAAGADGVFVPGVVDAAQIGALVAGIDAPVNVLARPGLADAATLAAIGVRRLSAGSAIAEAALGLAGRLATDFLAGHAHALFADAPRYGDLNSLMRQT